MRTTPILAVILATGPGGGILSGGHRGSRPRSFDARLSPYSPDVDHPWNQVHGTLFLRSLPDGGRRIHTADPLLYRGGTFLLDGDSHRQALTAIDQFLGMAGDRLTDVPLKRLYLQRDLWAAFDYAAWYPDDWVLKPKYEPAAIALRSRLAKAIGRLALDKQDFAALPDNYEAAAKSKQFAADYDPKRPERAFLPADLFAPAGPWVRFHEVVAPPMASRHYEGAGGRAAHLVFLRLPGGRAATELYLKELRAEEPIPNERRRPVVKQFPEGTMVAMVRRALAVDATTKVRATPVTELVQIRVYRRIPKNPLANREEGDFGEQDVCEFELDRTKLFAGEHGLRAVGRDEPAGPLFGRSEMSDPFERGGRTEGLPPPDPDMPRLKTCIECHQSPGIYSVLSTQRGLRRPGPGERFRNYDLDVELTYTVRAKVSQFDWGLLQGKLEPK